VRIDVKRIIERCGEVDPENWGSFGGIWEELEKIQFKVLGNPGTEDCLRVCPAFSDHMNVWQWIGDLP
jgi:hypothetical protein